MLFYRSLPSENKGVYAVILLLRDTCMLPRVQHCCCCFCCFCCFCCCSATIGAAECGREFQPRSSVPSFLFLSIQHHPTAGCTAVSRVPRAECFFSNLFILFYFLSAVLSFVCRRGLLRRERHNKLIHINMLTKHDTMFGGKEKINK